MVNPKQSSRLSRSVVHLIDKYLEPKEIFALIIKKEWPYATYNATEYGCRDRAMMATCFCSAGRISEVVGGPRFRWDKIKHRATKTGERHLGLLVENLHPTDKYILVSGMRVVKRSQKMIDKYGESICKRDDFVIPLLKGLFTNPFWDQLVPFGWLIKEYLNRFAPEKGKLFLFEDTRAFEIVDSVTAKFPNWFRAQSEHFYGHYLLTDTIKVAKFVNIQDPKHVKHYIGYSWNEQLRDLTVSMDFDWIEPTVEKIKAKL